MWPDELAGCRAEGHECDDFSLELSVPASTLMRQVAALHHLREALPGQRGLWGNVGAAAARVIDLKEALRAALSPRLEAALGRRAARESDVRVSMMYMHPASNAEADGFLGGDGGRNRYKRKRSDRSLAPIGAAGNEVHGLAVCAAPPECAALRAGAQFLQHRTECRRCFLGA
jgi:hypothetical protein